MTNFPDGMQTDQLELQRAMKGDEAAMRQLWLRHSPHIDAVVIRLCGDHDARLILPRKSDSDLQGAARYRVKLSSARGRIASPSIER